MVKWDMVEDFFINAIHNLAEQDDPVKEMQSFGMNHAQASGIVKEYFKRRIGTMGIMDEGDAVHDLVEEFKKGRMSSKNEKMMIAGVLMKIAKELMTASGQKVYYTMDNVGSAKYTVNFYDGVKKHSDGSAFYDIRTFKNKKDMDAFVMELHNQGYQYKRA